MKVYCFSGLGADERVFQFLNLPYETIFIQWIPTKRSESIEAYTARLATQINHQEPYIYLGVSFGGIIACELAKVSKPQQVILISSVAMRNELPFYYRLPFLAPILHLLPKTLLRPPSLLMSPLFGIHHKEHKKLFASIMKDTDLSFLKWALQTIVSWKNRTLPFNLVRIHGTKDYILPAPKRVGIKTISGGHFIIVSEATLISKMIIESIISTHE